MISLDNRFHLLDNLDMEDMNMEDAVLKYINRIRNAEKKDYAYRYAIWLARGPQDIVPEPQSFHLSYMAAQAVRVKLNAIMSGDS